MSEKSKKLFIANLSSKVRRSDLEDEFDRFGKIAEVKIRDGRHNDRFAFVEYYRQSDAEQAYKK